MSTVEKATSPFVDLLRNTGFVTLLVGAILSTLVVLLPSLSVYKDTLLPTLVTLIGIAVGGNTVQSVAKTNAQAKIEVAASQAEVAKAQVVAAQYKVS